MSRETFDLELLQLQEQLVAMGGMVEQAVNDAVGTLRHGDRKAARKLMEADRQINEKRYLIEHNTLTLIATQQPMARDLRLLAAILEITTELERIGDYAKGIGRVVVMLEDKKLSVARNEFKQMAKLGLDMLKKSLAAFMARDAEAARLIPPLDDEVDDLYKRVYHKLAKGIIADPTPANIDDANHLMWAAHNLERLADRVTNICERIVFVVTGEIMEFDVSDDEYREKPPKT
jgi:phosphate transport system protein